MTEVYIEVDDENDNVPHTVEPVYHSTVLEGSSEGTSVVKLEAYDIDDPVNGKLKYNITGGNLQGFFNIDHTNGMIILLLF